MTEHLIKSEAFMVGISVANLRKRRIWLGKLGEDLKYTRDPDQEQHPTRATKRQKRVLREHELLYSLRVFVENHCAHDQEWQTPQTIVQREDPRHPLQGYQQPVDADAWKRHALVAAQLENDGGPPPPRGTRPSSSASSKPSPPATAPPSPRERSRSPRRRPTLMQRATKAPPTRSPRETRHLKRSSETISSSASEQPESPPSEPKRRRIFTGRPGPPPSLSPTPSN